LGELEIPCWELGKFLGEEEFPRWEPVRFLREEEFPGWEEQGPEVPLFDPVQLETLAAFLVKEGD
jgi:hypothetical protein